MLRGFRPDGPRSMARQVYSGFLQGGRSWVQPGKRGNGLNLS